MIKAIYILKGKPGSSKDLLGLLNVISGRTSIQTGCISSQVWQNHTTSEVMLSEEWESMEDIMIHISSRLFKRMLAALEMSAEKPAVSYVDCEKIRGMDLIEEVIYIRLIPKHFRI